jgi:hypothetical protein
MPFQPRSGRALSDPPQIWKVTLAVGISLVVFLVGLTAATVFAP